MTNIERVKAMTIEELAIFLNSITEHCHMRGEALGEENYEERKSICKDCPIGDYVGCCNSDIEFWLKQEVQ